MPLTRSRRTGTKASEAEQRVSSTTPFLRHERSRDSEGPPLVSQGTNGKTTLPTAEFRYRRIKNHHRRGQVQPEGQPLVTKGPVFHFLHPAP